MDSIYEYNTKIIDAIKNIYLIKESDKSNLAEFTYDSFLYVKPRYFYTSELEKYLPRFQFFPNIYSFKLKPEDHKPSG